MRTTIVAATVAALLAGGVHLPAADATPPAPAGTSSAAPADTSDYHGILKLAGCSGSLVRLPQSTGSDPALALTNGHCNENGFPPPDTVQTDTASSASFQLLDAAGDQIATLRAAKIVYSTMTTTDVTIYQLRQTYDEIHDISHEDPLTLAASHPRAGAPVDVVSGYFTRTWHCSIDTFIYRLTEGDWTQHDSIRYAPGCDIIHGTSGSPMVAADGRTVVGINNTGSDNGERCTENNPCEIDEHGNVDYAKGRTYGQQTYQIPGCFDEGNRLDLDREGCALFKG